MNTLSSLVSGKTVGVFFGGQNPEHDISIITGSFILSELKKNGVDALPVYIGSDGKWYLGDELSQLSFFKGDFQKVLPSLSSYSLNIQDSQNCLCFESKSLFSTKKKCIDFAFPAFHGINGEDGTVQGLFEFFGVPYAGCGVFASSIAINKSIAKQMFVNEGINTSRFVSFGEDQYSLNKDEIHSVITEDLDFPVFVKPAKAGSSIGITKVNSEDDLDDALSLAFSYDDEVVVENGVPHIRDLTCAVLSNGKDVIASEIQEAIFEDGFLNYEDKYMKDGGTQLGGADSAIQIPAQITADQKETIQKLSKQIFSSMRANGTARIDFLLNEETGELFANEINTLPGTLYHHLWEKSGKEIGEVLSFMIADGLHRFEALKKNDIRFKSEVLNDANSMKLQYS